MKEIDYFSIEQHSAFLDGPGWSSISFVKKPSSSCRLLHATIILNLYVYLKVSSYIISHRIFIVYNTLSQKQKGHFTATAPPLFWFTSWIIIARWRDFQLFDIFIFIFVLRFAYFDISMAFEAHARSRSCSRFASMLTDALKHIPLSRVSAQITYIRSFPRKIRLLCYSLSSLQRVRFEALISSIFLILLPLICIFWFLQADYYDISASSPSLASPAALSPRTADHHSYFFDTAGFYLHEAASAEMLHADFEALTMITISRGGGDDAPASLNYRCWPLSLHQS